MERPRPLFAAAAEAMRRIHVENARRRRAEKRGGHLRRVDLDRAEAVAAAPPKEMLASDEALGELGRHDRVSGRLAQLHRFAGLSIEQADDAPGLSLASAYRLWTFARAWLASCIGRDDELR